MAGKEEIKPDPTLQQLHQARFSLVPIGPEKKPMIRAWKPYQHEPPSWEQIESWREALNPRAWANVTGPASGRIGLDFDGEKGFETLRRLELPVHRLTPNRGYHLDVEAPDWCVKTVNGKPG